MNLFTYEKGFCFVSYLSELSGDVKRFDRFLKVSAHARARVVRGGRRFDDAGPHGR